MKEFDLRKLIDDKDFLNNMIKGFSSKEMSIVRAGESEIKGHIQKAMHNLEFVSDNLKLGYLDWCLTGCYYSVYHAALALLLKKGYYSKNHRATLCLLIKEYYKKGVDMVDLELINSFYLDYQDLLFYVQSKQEREKATYTSKIVFDKQSVNSLRLKAILFVNKVKGII